MKKSFEKCGIYQEKSFEKCEWPDYPLRAYQDFQAFKLFAVDIGLLGAMSKLNAKVILEGNRLFEEFKGALTEQYVLQQLTVNPDNDIFYWMVNIPLYSVGVGDIFSQNV